MPHFPFRHQEEPHHLTGTLLGTLTGHTGQVTAIAWSPDGRFLASAGYESTVRIWNLATGQPIAILGDDPEDPEDGIVPDVAWSPDGRLVAFGGESTHLWSATLGDRLPPLTQPDLAPDESNPVWCVAWSPGSRSLASGYDDGTIRIWDAIYTTQLATLEDHERDNTIKSVAWSPDGRLLASASNDWTVCLWDVRTNQTVAVIRPKRGGSMVAWSPDGRLLASAGSSSPMIWDASIGQQLTSQWKGQDEMIWAAAWSPDGRLLATASEDKTVGLWDVHQGKRLATLTGHTGPVSDVAWSPDGRLLASGGEDKTVRIWSVG